MKNKALVLLMVFYSSLIGFAQDYSPCQQILEKYIYSMAGINLPTAGKKHEFHFSISTEFRRGTQNSTSNTQLTITISNNYYHYTSPQLSFFSDSKESLVFIHPQKIIIQKKHNSQVSQPRDISNLLQLQKQLIEQGKIVACGKATLNSETFFRISLQMSEAFKKLYQISQVDYWFEATQDKLKKVEMAFTDKTDKLRQEIFYHSLALNVIDRNPKRAQDYLYSSPGNLKKEFKDYQLIRQ